MLKKEKSCKKEVVTGEENTTQGAFCFMLLCPENTFFEFWEKLRKAIRCYSTC